MSSSMGGEAIYQFLLKLFPRQFQEEFAPEMQDAFHDLVVEAYRQGKGSLAQVYFFELIDLPFCLLTEHLAHLRREWSMNRIPHGSRPLRSAEMGALGLLIGSLIYLLITHWLIVLPNWWNNVPLGNALLYLRDMVAWTLANALFGVFLAISVGGSRKVVVRTFLIMGALTFLRELILAVFMIYGPWAVWTNFWSRQTFSFSQLTTSELIWMPIEFDGLSLLSLGIFTGLGLGLTIGGWRVCLKFVLLSLLAYVSGYIVAQALGLALYHHTAPWLSCHPAHLVTIENFIVCVFLVIVVGGMLGWFWGKQEKEIVSLPPNDSSGPTEKLAAT
jgi:hypothetical protein